MFEAVTGSAHMLIDAVLNTWVDLVIPTSLLDVSVWFFFRMSISKYAVSEGIVRLHTQLVVLRKPKPLYKDHW